MPKYGLEYAKFAKICNDIQNMQNIQKHALKTGS